MSFSSRYRPVIRLILYRFTSNDQIYKLTKQHKNLFYWHSVTLNKTLLTPTPVISLKPIRKSAAAGSRVDEDLKYECEDCQVADITCRGASVTGRVSVVPEDKRINFNFPRCAGSLVLLDSGSYNYSGCYTGSIST